MDNQDHMASDNVENIEQNILKKDLKQTKKKMIKWVVSIGSLVILASLVVALWNPVAKLIADQQKTIMDYETESLEQLTDQIVKSYQTLFVVKESSPKGLNYHITYDIDPKMLNTVEQHIPKLAAITSLKDVSFDIQVENHGNRSGISASINHAEAELPRMDVQYDPEIDHLYVALAGLTNDYFDFDLGRLSEDMDLPAQILIHAKQPQAEEVESFLNSYSDELVRLMTPQATTKEKITLGGIKQKCKVYSATLDYKAVNELNERYAAELCKMLFDDSAECDYYNNKIKDCFTKKSYETVYWTDYIDAKGRIIGRTIKCDEDTMIDYIFAEDDKALSFDAWLSATHIFGTVKKKNKGLNGKFEIDVHDEEYLEIKLNDVQIDADNPGQYSGTLQLQLSDDLVQTLFTDSTGLPVDLDIQFVVDKDHRQYTLRYLDMLSVCVDVTEYVPDTLSLPDGKGFDGSATDALRRWLEGLDMKKLKEELNKLGLPVSK